MNNFFILVLDNISQVFRTRRAIVFLALSFLLFGGVMQIYTSIQKEINKSFESHEINEENREVILTFARVIVKSQVDNDLVNFLLSVPVFNIIILFSLIIGIPLLIVLLKYDVIASETYEKTIRYLAFRVDRKTYFFAKFSSSVIEFMILTAIFTIGAILLGVTQLESLKFFPALLAGFEFWVLLQIFFAVFIALMLCLSAWVNYPFHALLMSSLFFLIFWWVLPGLIFWIFTLDIGYISPYWHISGFFYGFSWQYFQSFFIYLVMTGLFLGLGYFIFLRKNLG